jgi:uncharacterized membrane protein
MIFILLSTFVFLDFYDYFIANLALQLTGLVALIVAVVLLSVYSCCLSNKYLAYVAIGFLLFAGKFGLLNSIG